jgi:hypothetical protein
LAKKTSPKNGGLSSGKIYFFLSFRRFPAVAPKSKKLLRKRLFEA